MTGREAFFNGLQLWSLVSIIAQRVLQCTTLGMVPMGENISTLTVDDMNSHLHSVQKSKEHC